MPANPQVTDEMVEKAAMALDPLAFGLPSYMSADGRKDDARIMARAALEAALADHVVVPREPTVEMLAAAFPCEANEEMSHADKVLGAATCLKLGGGVDMGLLEGEAVKQAAFLARDYRLMISAAPLPQKEG